jgi:hypothetical protein
MEKQSLDELLMPAYEKLIEISKKAKNEYKGEKDTRIKHFEVLASDLAEQINLIKCFNHFVEKHPQEFKNITNYSENNNQIFIERVNDLLYSDFFLKVIMRTEMFFRDLYLAVNQGIDINSISVNRLVAFLLNDTENNWQKEGSKLCLMLWDARNSIHNSGVYTKADKTHIYKGQNFDFKKGMAGVPFSIEDLVRLVRDLLDECYKIIVDPRIKAIQLIEHPFYKVFGK